MTGPAGDLRETLLPQPAAAVARRAVEHAGALEDHMEISPLLLHFTSPALERAYGAYRAVVGVRPLRAGLLALACAHLPIVVSLEFWQLYTRHAFAGYSWAFALVAAASLVAAFTFANQPKARSDAIGCALLVVLSWCVVARALYAHVDPLAPPVALSILFYLGAGPSIVRVRFVSMLAAAGLIAAAHAAAATVHHPSSKYWAWYEAGVAVIGVMSALSCRRLEVDHRREFFLLACMGVQSGGLLLQPGGALALAPGPGGRPTPIGDALHELRDLAHRLHLHLPTPHVPTDVMERALGDSGARSLADLLLHGAHPADSSHGAGPATARPGGRHGPAWGQARHRRSGSEPPAFPLPPGGARPQARAVGTYAPPALPGGVASGSSAAAAGAPAEDAEACTGDAPAVAGDADARSPRGEVHGAAGGLRLVTSAELPGYFAPYDYVLRGYRNELTAGEALRSLFAWHNETINVWSEFLPAAAFAVASRRFLKDEVIAALPETDRVLLTCGLVVALVVRPLCSGAAHLLYCSRDRRMYALWWSVDYISICAAILSASLVAAHNSFYCEPELAHLFFVCSSGLLCTSMIAVLCTASSGVRAASFLLFVIFCNIVPLGYQLISKVGGWYHNDAPWPYLYNWVASLGILLVGLVVKSASVPEVCRPGAFDYIGASHQLWHVCINVAFVLGTLRAWRVYAYWRADTPCPLSPDVGPGNWTVVVPPEDANWNEWLR